MKFNLSKCHKLTLSGRTKMTEKTIQLIDENTLSNVENEKDLGVIIDSRLLLLRFGLLLEHIAKKTKLANSMVAIIKKRFLNLTEEIVATLKILGETISGIRQSIVKPIPEKRLTSD